MWGRTYEGACTGWGDWEAGNRYHRNSLEACALYTYNRPTSARVGGESDTGRRPATFVFSLLVISFCVHTRWGIQRHLYNPKIPPPAHLDVCLVYIINFLIIWGSTYEGGLYWLGRLGDGKPLPSKKLGSRCLVYLPSINIAQSLGGTRYRPGARDLCIFDT